MFCYNLLLLVDVFGTAYYYLWMLCYNLLLLVDVLVQLTVSGGCFWSTYCYWWMF